MMEGKDEWKYRKIYNKEGVLSKGTGSDVLKGSYKDFLKNGKNSKWEKYGHSNEGRDHYNDIKHLNPESLLDVGCGWNEFCSFLKVKFLKNKQCVGVDIACPGADFIAPAHKMPMFENDQFDLITSFDCIEHIPEEEVDETFKEFSRVGKRIFLKICLEDSPTTIDDCSLHVCIKPEEWWLQRAEKHFLIEKSYVHGTAKFDKDKGEVIYKFPGDRARSLVLLGRKR